jgi:hypothetical protein
MLRPVQWVEIGARATNFALLKITVDDGGCCAPRFPEKGRLMSAIRHVIGLAVTDGVPLRAFWVAVIVGTVLNLINQGDALASGAHLNWAKLALTYAVPFAVSTHGAVSARLRLER